MKSDIENSTFSQRKHFSRVLMQQGRVELSANSNERHDILLHYLWTLASDLIGPHGGPDADAGFEITPIPTTGPITDLRIGRGRYYVHGRLCENDLVDKDGDEVEVTYRTQPDYPLTDEEKHLPHDCSFLVYLDVWERHITDIEDPGIREVALDGPDSATRAKVVWQVKITDKMPDKSDIPNDITKDQVEASWNRWVESWQPTNRGRLKAEAKEGDGKDTEPCTISPEARYRGTENQLYRVEIHNPGAAIRQEDADYGREGIRSGDVATFKWSRDNGSVAFPVQDIDVRTVTLKHLGRDSRLSLRENDLVQIEDDDSVLKGRADPLLRIEEIDPINMRVTLNKPPLSSVGRVPNKHPLLRRWDHGTGDSKKDALEKDSGTLVVREDAWLKLEDGVKICFRSAPHHKDTQNIYRTADYWTIPARTATGDVEWPADAGQPEETQPPHGIEHHYAPLSVIRPGSTPIDCRYIFEPLRSCCKPQQQASEKERSERQETATTPSHATSEHPPDTKSS